MPWNRNGVKSTPNQRWGLSQVLSIRHESLSQVSDSWTSHIRAPSTVHPTTHDTFLHKGHQDPRCVLAAWLLASTMAMNQMSFQGPSARCARSSALRRTKLIPALCRNFGTHESQLEKAAWLWEGRLRWAKWPQGPGSLCLRWSIPNASESFRHSSLSSWLWWDHPALHALLVEPVDWLRTARHRRSFAGSSLTSHSFEIVLPKSEMHHELFPDTGSSPHVSVCHPRLQWNAMHDLSPGRAELSEVERLRWCSSILKVDARSDQPLCHGRQHWSSAWGEPGDTGLLHLEHPMNLDAEWCWEVLNLGHGHKDTWKECSSQVCNSVVPVMRREKIP